MEPDDSGSAGITSIRESPVVHSESPVTHSIKRERHARTPDSVLLDHELSLEAKAVYGILSRHSFKSGKAYIGTRRLASLLGTSQSTVSRGVNELLECHHIEHTSATEKGKRAGYRLLSNIFLPREKRYGQKKKTISSTLRYAKAFVDNQAG